MSTVVGPALNRGLMSASRQMARAADVLDANERQGQEQPPAGEEELVFDIGSRGSGSPIGTRAHVARSMALLYLHMLLSSPPTLLSILEDRREKLRDSM